MLGVLLASAAWAQGFDSGSDGSDGDLNVTANTTLDLPPDGIFNFGTVRVDGRQGAGATLSFRRNALNTPVYILATGDIVVGQFGRISVDGQNNPQSDTTPGGAAGGPGGFDGGDPGIQDIPPGDGHGPGAGAGGRADLGGSDDGSAGAAVYAGIARRPSAGDGTLYGSHLLVPLVGGSGGGGGASSGDTSGIGGSGGGGAILLASNTRVVITGRIDAQGGSGPFRHPGQGSGGAIRIVAPAVEGNGRLNVEGGSGFEGFGLGDIAGHGYIRIDTIDRSGFQLGFDPVAAMTVGSFMLVFPPAVPRLDVIEVAGQAITPGAPAEIILPVGTDPSQTVVVRGSDFVEAQAIEVVLVPSNGPRQLYAAEIDMSTNPDQVSVNVELPVNVRTRVWVWTR
jgi:hypothetical protein